MLFPRAALRPPVGELFHRDPARPADPLRLDPPVPRAVVQHIDQLAERVRAHFGHSAEERADLERQQRAYRPFLVDRGFMQKASFTRDSVVYDRRTDALVDSR
jgi:hypothetical protein